MSVPNADMIGGYNTYSNLFWLLGGEEPTYPSEEYTYNVVQNQFKSIGLMPSKYTGNSYTTLNGLNSSLPTYVFFSNDYNNANSLNFWRFDIMHNKLSQIGNKYPKPKDSFAECYCTDGKQYIFLIGGSSSADYTNALNTFWKFDIDRNTWSSGPNLKATHSWEDGSRSDPGCIYVSGQIFVFGGDDEKDDPGRPWLVEIQTIKLNGGGWSILDAELDNDGNGFMTPRAFYPSRNVIDHDNWISNTIFIVGVDENHLGGLCNKFNFRASKIEKCSVSFKNVPMLLTAGIYGYVQNEYRYYMFGGWNQNDVATIQYAVFDFTNSTNN